MQRFKYLFGEGRGYFKMEERSVVHIFTVKSKLHMSKLHCLQPGLSKYRPFEPGRPNHIFANNVAPDKTVSQDLQYLPRRILYA